MQTDKKKIWFPAKRYGWGWGPPCAWQGWVVFVIWLVLLAGGGSLLAPHNVLLFVAYSILLGLALFLVVLSKGETPRWRWGEDVNRQSRSSADRLAESEELRRRKLVSESEYQARRQEILRDL